MEQSKKEKEENSNGYKDYPKKSIKSLESKTENKKIIDLLKSVKDPELGIDIWSMGLVYDINLLDKKLEIVMTFTSPMCPYGPQIVDLVVVGLKKIGFKNPKIEIVFAPLWKPSAELKEMLGIPN